MEMESVVDGGWWMVDGKTVGRVGSAVGLVRAGLCLRHQDMPLLERKKTQTRRLTICNSSASLSISISISSNISAGIYTSFRDVSAIRFAEIPVDNSVGARKERLLV